MKKLPSHKRLIKYILRSFEVNFPKFTRRLRYHSIVEHPNRIAVCEIQNKKIDWISGDKRNYLSLLDSTYKKIEISHQTLQILKIETTSYNINGNLKHPINSLSDKVLRFYPLDDLSLTDAYPLPLYRNVKVFGTIIFIPNIENYYHLVVDYLLPSLLYIVNNQKLFNHVTFVTQRKFPLITVMCDVLSQLNITSSILHISPFDKVTGGTLLLRGSIADDHQIQYVFPKELRALRTLLRVPNRSSTRIYISRKNAKRRTIINESELFKILPKYNIEVVTLDFADAQAQIDTFKNAKLIISTHGASLTNLIWAEKVHVIEIFPIDLTPKHYLNFSAQLGHDYTPFFASQSDQSENFKIDVEIFDQFLGQIIKSIDE